MLLHNFPQAETPTKFKIQLEWLNLSTDIKPTHFLDVASL